MIMVWSLMNSGTIDDVGLIANFVSDDNPDPAAKQFDDNYQHGGGWRPFKGHKFDPMTLELSYPGDPPMEPVATTNLRDEIIYVYPYAWVLILQKDGSFEVSRMD